MDDDQQFCLRWNNHQSTLISVFDTLLENGTLVDCTLAAEGKFLKAHKVVLSACSPYFATLLSQQYDKHPIFILKDVKFQELRAMMDYMYRGEVNISQDQLAALLKAAESLQIKGLSDNRGSAPSTATHPQQPQQQPPSQQQKQSDASAKTLQPPVPASKASGLTIENKRPLKSELLESDLSGSREGSTSPTRKRKKVRRRSVDTNNLLIDNHDQHSNSSSHSIHTASGAGVAAVGATVGSAAGATAAGAGASSLSSSAVAGGGGVGGAAGSNSGANVLSAAAVAAAAAIKKTETAQQAAELIKLQLQKQQIAAAAAAAQSSDDDERCGGPGSVATATEHDDGNDLTDNEHDGDGGSSVKSGARHHREGGKRGNKTSTSTVGDLLIEPKSEYEDGQDENIEDLTMDDEELMDELDQAGPSHGGDVSSQGYAQWSMDREQNEAFIAAQDAVGGQHRDAQGDEASGNDGGPSGAVGAEGAGSSSAASCSNNDQQHQHHTGTGGVGGGHSFVHSIDSGANSGGNLSNSNEGKCGGCSASSSSSSNSNSSSSSSSSGGSHNDAANVVAAVAATAIALNQQKQHPHQHQVPALSVGSTAAATAAAVAALVGGNVMADYMKCDLKGGFPLSSLVSPPIGGEGEGPSSQQSVGQQQHLVTATSLQLQAAQSQPLTLHQLKQQQQQQQQQSPPIPIPLLSPKSPPIDEQPCDLRMLTPATYLRELASGGSKESLAVAVQLATSANTGSASGGAALPISMFNNISMTTPPPPPVVPPPIVGGTYSCTRCGNSYARPHSLNRHIRFECGVEPKFECPVCHKKSKHKHNLVLHMRTHQHR